VRLRPSGNVTMLGYRSPSVSMSRQVIVGVLTPCLVMDSTQGVPHNGSPFCPMPVESHAMLFASPGHGCGPTKEGAHWWPVLTKSWVDERIPSFLGYARTGLGAPINSREVWCRTTAKILSDVLSVRRPASDLTGRQTPQQQKPQYSYTNRPSRSIPVVKRHVLQRCCA
jgi:hypothetical protein